MREEPTTVHTHGSRSHWGLKRPGWEDGKAGSTTSRVGGAMTGLAEGERNDGLAVKNSG